MSTTVGNGLTVDGTVKASQATQAGEAVVLGDDGLIPANLVASGGNMNIVSYSSWADVLTASRSGKIPVYANAYLRLYKSSSYQTVIRVTALNGSGPYMPVEGTIYPPDSGNQYVARSISGSYIMYQDNTVGSLKQTSLSNYTIDSIKVVWSD